MDLVKASVFAAGAFVVTNLALSFIVGPTMPLLYLLPSFLAGVVSSAYHAQFGSGGWVRHLVAVFLAPLVMGIYLGIVGWAQGGGPTVFAFVGSLATAVLAAAAGMGVVMGVRWLMAARDVDDEADAEVF